MPHTRLHFPPTAKIDGFTNAVTSVPVYAEGVVRELLQNALDSAISAGRRAEVHLTVTSVPLDSIPKVAAYKSAFNAAFDERLRGREEFTLDEENAIGRILEVLEADEANVLFCRDNGIGLDAERMRAVLSQGNSDKPNKGAGSFGLGHLAAFAASDLRYVLYAGKRGEDHVISGHAIVATHPTDDVSASRRSADGYWAVPEKPFNLKTAQFGRTIPGMLEEQVKLIGDSGTVVAILGFNHFRKAEAQRAFRDIVRVAAVNFLAAIQGRKMVVRVSDDTLDADQVIDHRSLEPCLAKIRKQKRSRRGAGGGWLPGEQAFRAYETLQQGEELEVPPFDGDVPDPSVRVFFRSLATSERTRVQVFRDGMWITYRAPHLEFHAFGKVRPFDAVVLLADPGSEREGTLYDLVRNAEGPAHRHLERRRLKADSKRRLTNKLRSLARVLSEHAGTLATDEGFAPEGFAVFPGDAERIADSIPRRRPRRREGKKKGTSDNGDDDPSPVPNGNGRRRRKGGRSRRAPAPGPAVDMRSGLVLLPDAEDENGAGKRVRAAFELCEELGNEDICLRIRAESGSDAGCDSPIPDEWLGIQQVETGGMRIEVGGQSEVRLPTECDGNVLIRLSGSVHPDRHLELDLVRRKREDEEAE
ncbi:MAG: hypothetical protein F4139_10325 [Gemmatimonadetes bacterium]|nr:hypothetical protein [Gemmatimonadota bacterium]MYH53331.1 hypothetical protein [Gemmatimonadota bacterium]MYK65345.1 hypothetical protein [Gemmatimonadota bacterium]